MKRVLAAICFAVAGAVALAAQPPYKEEPRKPSQEKKAPTAGQQKTMTVSGCLRAGDGPNTFILENVKTDVAAGEKATGTTGTTITQGATLRLTGAPAKMDLKAHVGHTVQLTGMLVPQGRTPTASTPKTTPSTPTTPPQPTTPPEPTFNVKAMKHISGTCPM